MKQYTKNDLAFIQFVKDECKRLGVKQHIKDVTYVKISPQIKCSGYFDDTDPENVKLACSMRNPNGLEILVHEYCHMTQWEDEIPLWKKAGTALGVIDDWLSGKRVTTKLLDRSFELAIELELDNEKRSVEMIKEWGLSIDIKQYIQKANSYLFFYRWLRKTRKWANPKNQPYNNKRVVKTMPVTFYRVNYKRLPKKYEMIYKEENI